MDDAKKDQLIALGRMIAEDKRRLEQAISFVLQGARMPEMSVTCNGRGCGAVHSHKIPSEELSWRSATRQARVSAEASGWLCGGGEGGDRDLCPVCRDEVA